MVTNGPSDRASEGNDTRLPGALRAVDQITSFVERPVRRVSGSADLNPLPHAGTISVFLLGVVVVSGLYITLFFPFGHAASYDAVAAMEEHAIQRVVRALHRYSSAALVLTTVVHAWRIFASQRFVSHRRRWRWMTGVVSLVIVWLAGVTGYWLIWDRRAAAISEATAQVLAGIGWGEGFAVRHLLGVSPGTGSGFLLALWFIHLGLTAVIGWFMFRHLRRSKQAWLPAPQWMALMGGGLLIVSLLLPLGMLGPARPDQLVVDMPLDPFVLFLLPPLLSELRWFALAAFVVVIVVVGVLPWLLRRSDPDVVSIDEDACTGCEICVVDCPYDALSMAPHTNAPDDRSVAVLDADQCVSCGICLGSCAFDAIELPGWSPPAHDVAGHTVRVVCSRHVASDSADDAAAGDAVVVPVACAGMFTSTSIRGYIDRGATGVELVGCAPSDCRYGLGNQLAEERLAGSRAPHAPRRYAPLISTAWVDIGEEPHPLAPVPAEDVDPNRNRLVAPGLLVLASVLAVVAATRAPFRTEAELAEIRIVVDHVPGSEIVEVERAAGSLDAIEISIDGEPRETVEISSTDDRAVGYHAWPVEAGEHRLSVDLLTSTADISLFDGSVELDRRERFVLTATDAPPPPGAAEGRDVFDSRAAGCASCHSLEEGRDVVGPSLYGIADIGATRVEGLTAGQYLRQSILLPDQYVVDGWRAGQMLPIYRERLTEVELESLLAFLETLTLEDAP